MSFRVTKNDANLNGPSPDLTLLVKVKNLTSGQVEDTKTVTLPYNNGYKTVNLDFTVNSSDYAVIIEGDFIPSGQYTNGPIRIMSIKQFNLRHYNVNTTTYTDVVNNQYEVQGNYRYGFQGQEMDNEIKGVGNSINYKYRMHDPRIGRFFAVDPLAPKLAYNSPYAFSENRVIDGIELEGLEVVLIGKQASMGAFISGASEGGIAFDFNGNFYSYGSLSIGLETNASVASQISVTIFPTMPEVRYAGGWGFDGGVSAGELFVGSINASLAEGCNTPQS